MASAPIDPKTGRALPPLTGKRDATPKWLTFEDSVGQSRRLSLTTAKGQTIYREIIATAAEEIACRIIGPPVRFKKARSQQAIMNAAIRTVLKKHGLF